MLFTQSDVTRFYDALVFPSRVNDSAYSLLASEVVKDGWRVGDFGCGQSLFYSAFQNRHLKPVFLDISFNAIKTIDYGAKIRADITQIPLKDGIFNAIFCIGVIHHLPDMYPALTELTRVITKGGILVIGIYDPTSFGARLKHTYDAININFLKKTISYGANVLLWVKLRRQFKLSWRDVRKRIADLLDTPIVKYLPTEYYEKMATQAGLITVDRGKISNMRILHFKKVLVAGSM